MFYLPSREVRLLSEKENRRIASSFRQGLQQERGVALVIVLTLLILILVVVLAYFSRATLHRQISSSSVANAKAGLFSQSAAGYILDDIQHEIQAGSEADAMTGAAVKIHRPTTITVPGVSVPVAPSMAPQRVGDNGIANIVKVSRSGTPFFTSTTGYRTIDGRAASGLARASSVSTTAPSVNGRSLDKERWNAPKLMTAADLNSFVVPDWIYVDRAGKNPTTFSGSMANSAPENNDYVIGRYAYVIYDVGGLIDINVVGNRLQAADNARRGYLHQVSLKDGIGGVSLSDFPEFVKWRSTFSSTNSSTTAGSGGLFDPKRTFLDVPSGEQAFVNRQDLIAYINSSSSGPLNPPPNSPSNESPLPFLTTFSRDINAPSYAPNPNRPKLPASPDPDQINPAFPSVRFETDTILVRPDTGSVSVKAGTPVMPRRFPLSKLNLFAEQNPDPAAMEYYFGLKKIDNYKWEYVATTTPDKRIRNLKEVALLGREPNFFEVLQAAMLNGSLGKSAADTYTDDDEKDAQQRLQIMQIGANIIDQWDGDDTPTCIQYPSMNSGELLSFYGIENLPYISQIGLVGYRPSYDPDKFQIWAIFDVWNPHQNARTLPVGVDAFRIVPLSGSGSGFCTYYLEGSYAGYLGVYSPLYNPTNIGKPAKAGAMYQIPTQDIVSLNEGRGTQLFDVKKRFNFPAAVDYSEPKTLVSAPPSSSTDSVGILLSECSPGIAIPPLGSREPEMQQSLNELMDAVAPYTAKLPDGTEITVHTGYDYANANPPHPEGKRQYPNGTTFAQLNTTYWLQEGNLISAKYGTKAHNAFRLLRRSGAPYAFALEAHYSSDNKWRTYQTFEGFFQQAEIAVTRRPTVANPLLENQGDGIGHFAINTHPSVAGADLSSDFNVWRSRGSSVSLMRADPRTSRFGHAGLAVPPPLVSTYKDFMGFSTRSSTQAFDLATVNDTRWLNPKTTAYSPGYSGGLVAGFQAPAGVSKPILFGFATNNPDRLDAKSPLRYPDVDGVVRPGDAYFGTVPLPNGSSPAEVVPMAKGEFSSRPIILNRPFRSVGELGYVFRDIPWKTLDFFTQHSGDLALLDVFSISENEGEEPITAGQVNLNTRQEPVLAALLQGSSKQEEMTTPPLSATGLTSVQAQNLAKAIVDESKLSPFSSRGDLVTRVLNKTGTDPLAGETIKAARESAIRSLSEMGTTRTWNLLIDLVVQTGRFTAASSSGNDFLVQGEDHVWIHVSIDRLTGRVLKMQKETVYE